MNIGIVLYLGMIITGVPVGILIDYIANKRNLPNEDYYSPAPWALLGLVWPLSLFPFLIYCLLHNKKRKL